MRLKHMVKDKINYRATGRRSALTRQTNQGRANDGGLRIGEMERDGIMGHGLSYFLNESYMVRGDQYYMAVCNKTGMIAIYNPNKNLFLSPMSDGPLKFNRTPEGEPILDVFSRFGRSFSLLRVPYALKLLIQELQVMNVQMRIITEENVDQLLNLSYQSKNLNKLMNVSDTDFKDMNALVTQYKNQLNEKISKSSNEVMLRRNSDAALRMNIQEVEPQNFDGINIQVNPEAQKVEENGKWDQYTDAELAEIDKKLGWFPPNEEGTLSKSSSSSSSNVMNQWQPQNEWSTTSSSTPSSPGYAPPDFSESGLKNMWTKLTDKEQRQIIILPDEQQEEAMRNLLITREKLPIVPNYGSDGELNAYFARLSRPEQIKLLLMSLEDQKTRLEEMAKNASPSDEFNKLRIIIPENKTSSEKLYGSPELKMLAPTENKDNDKKDSNKSEGESSDKKDDTESSNKSGGNSNIKTVTF
jgi:Spy/CpxP family protein refolding chaperone